MANSRYDFWDLRGRVQFKFDNESPTYRVEQFNDMKTKYVVYVIIAVIGAAVIMSVLFCFLCRRRRRRRMKQQEALQNVYTAPPTVSGVENQLRVPPPGSGLSQNLRHNRISSVGDRFAVPLDLLPSNFNYNAPGVEHNGTFVLIKDLGLLNEPHKDEYQVQSPYNPNYS